MNAMDIDNGNTTPPTAAYKVATVLGVHRETGGLARVNRSETTAATQESSSATSTDASTITSSDFLTLLVSELQNQDPTQPTDPNAYITQLVGVNSLQQLISIDQGVTALDPTTTTSSGSVSATTANGK